MSSTVPLSVRVSQEDASFIAKLKIEDAVTPSDKVRAIIKKAKERYEQKQDYDGMVELAKDVFRDEKETIKKYELNAKKHSELLTLFAQWLEESFAFYGSAVDTTINPEKPSDNDMKTLEDEVVKRIFRLLDMVTRMGVTKSAPCYDPKVIHKNYEPLLELTDMVSAQLKKKK